MIRLSVNNDKEGIVSLWHEAFGDSRDEIMFFLDNKYEPENTLVYEINGEIASMLFLLDGDMCIKGIDYPSYYLYAACTSKKYRGQGLMAELLSFVKETAIGRNKYFICLMPAEKSLFDFYEKHGYKTVFKQKNLTVSRGDIEILLENTVFSDIPSCSDFAQIRNEAFKKYDRFKWDNTSVDFAFRHNRLYFGKDFCNSKGFALYNEGDAEIYVKELAFTENSFAFAVKKLFALTDCDKMKIKLPADYETSLGKFEISDSAMMLALNKNADNLINEIKNAYLGLTLD